MLKHYRVVGTKKFALTTTAISIPVIGWFLADPNFFSIIKTPDNIPIVILLFLVSFLTWFAIYRAAVNDERIEQGLEPIEATPENREKVWTWPNLVYTELFAIIACTAFLVVWAIVFKAPFFNFFANNRCRIDIFLCTSFDMLLPIMAQKIIGFSLHCCF